MSFIANLSVDEKVNIIVHTNDVNNKEMIKTLLSKFHEYFDGWEGTVDHNIIVSYRYYWYGVPKKDIADMIQTLHKNKHIIKTRVAINPVGYGNYSFD